MTSLFVMCPFSMDPLVPEEGHPPATATLRPLGHPNKLPLLNNIFRVLFSSKLPSLRAVVGVGQQAAGELAGCF